MSPKGIELGIASETKAFKQGVELGIIKPLEDAVDSLDDLGKSKGPDKLERGFKDAQTASEKLEKETKQTANSIESEFRQAYKKVGNTAQDGYRKAGTATQDFKDEAKSNFAEVASSFDGSISGAVDGVQGTLAGASVAIGGAAGVALGALALVGGAIGSTITNAVEEDAAKAEERISSMYADFLESGKNYRTQDQIERAASDIAGDPEAYKQALADAKILGTTVGEYLAAQAGSVADRDRIQYLINAKLAEQNQLLEDGNYKNGTLLTDLEGVRDRYKNITDSTTTAAERADAVRDAVARVNEQYQGQGVLLDKNKDKIVNFPKEVPVAVTIQTPDIDSIARTLNRRAAVTKIKFPAAVFTRNGKEVF